MSFYKYLPYNKDVSVTRTVVTRVHKKKVDIDISNLVQLGGTFEKIGEDDEAIGGGNQKVGTNNQQ